MKVATTPAKLHIIRHKSIQVVAEGIGLENYRKIPKISPGAYILRLFLRGLFLEGLIFEGLIYGEKFAFQNRLG